MKTYKLARNGVIAGFASAIIMAMYFLLLSVENSNTLVLHNIGKSLIVIVPIFLLFRNHFHNYGKLKLRESFTLGGSFALSAAVVLVISELLLHKLFSVALTPQEFVGAEISSAALYFLLTLEIFGYALLSLFLGFQFYKNRYIEEQLA